MTELTLARSSMTRGRRRALLSMLPWPRQAPPPHDQICENERRQLAKKLTEHGGGGGNWRILFRPQSEPWTRSAPLAPWRWTGPARRPQSAGGIAGQCRRGPVSLQNKEAMKPIFQNNSTGFSPWSPAPNDQTEVPLLEMARVWVEPQETCRTGPMSWNKKV